MAIRPMFVHCRADAGYDARFDTVTMPNLGVATLNGIAQSMLGYPGVAFDEQYPGPNCDGRERQATLALLCAEIEQALAAGDQPVVFCSVLSYNAEGSMSLLASLKQAYGKRLRTGVGGQLVRTCAAAYATNPAIDCVAVGDAEVTLGSLLAGRRFASGYLNPTAASYAAPIYDNYIGLEDRLADMATYRFGPLTGIRQLLVESVRGCSWADIHQVCSFCSLMGVDETPVFRPLAQHFTTNRQLIEHYGLTWLFDVSNNWVPTLRRGELVGWLQEYIAARKRFGEPDIAKYVYLTSNAITGETAPLLREAGVKMAYIGLDGWDRETKTAHHKAQTSAEQVLELCHANGILVRTSLVIGGGLTEKNVAELVPFVGRLVRDYRDTILSFGNFIEILLPGAPVWYEFQQKAIQDKIEPAVALYRRFYQQGYLSWVDQERLSALYIGHTQPVTYEAVIAARDVAHQLVEEAGMFAIQIEKNTPPQKTVL